MKIKVILARVLIVLVTFLGLIVPIYAQEGGFAIVGSCIDNETLENGVTLNVSGTPITIVQETINCPYGCINNSGQYGDECNELVNENINFILFPISMFLVAGIFGFLSTKMDKNTFAVLFLGLTLVFIILGMGFLVSWASLTVTESTALVTTGYTASIWSLILTVFMFVLMIILTAVKPILEKKKVI